MTETPRHLVYFDKWMDPIGDRMAAEIPSVALQRLSFDDDPEANWPTMMRAHGYQMLPSTETRAPFIPDAAFIARCPDLLALSATGAGSDMVDVEACTAAGVLVVNQSGSNAESVAQHVLCMMLALTKQIVQSDRAIRREGRDWTRWDYVGQEVTGRTVGIIGLGNVGRRVAALCGGLFGMRVIAYDPLIGPEDFIERGAESVDLATLMASADFVSVNCPLTKVSRGMIGGAEFAAMKSGSFFVTTARGGIHDEAALAKALSEGRIAGAGLDVFVEEPPAADHPLLEFDNVVVSPHNAGVTTDSGFNSAKAAAEQWAVIFAGRRPPRLVNPEAWDGFAQRYEALFGAPISEVRAADG